MLGMGMKRKHVQVAVDDDTTEDDLIIEPYQDEPDGWDRLPDEQKAQVWYHLALIEQDSNMEVPPDGSDLQWYQNAANGGNPCAQYVLGKMYFKGVMTSQNIFQSNIWYSRASASGCSFADYELAKICGFGIGMDIDKSSAESLYRKAYEAFRKLESKTPNKAVELKLAILCENKLVNEVESTQAEYWRKLLSDSISPSSQSVLLSSAESQAQQIATKQPEISDEPDSPIKIAIGNFRSGKLEDIPIEYIYPSSQNRYAEHDTEEEIQALASSIQTMGLINPIALNKISETEYRIISGEKRYRAVTGYLQWKTIPSTVRENLSPNAAQLMLNAANLDTREYSAGQKLQFYIDTEQLLQKMKSSGEYSGPMQSDIAELIGLSTHQVRKYKRIVERLPTEQLQEVVNGNISVERAYKLTIVPKVTETNEKPDVDEEPITGCTSAFEEKSDADEDPITGRTLAFEEEPDADVEPATGRTSAFEEEPDADEEPATGRTSAFEEKPDADEEPTTGRTSAFEEKPDADEKPTTGRTSAFDEEPDADEEPTTGRTSAFDGKPDVDENFSKIDEPANYSGALSLLSKLPIEPGQLCAVIDGDTVNGGTIDRIEIYENTVLLSIISESLRRPYPISQLGKSVFVGSGCFDKADKTIHNPN